MRFPLWQRRCRNRLVALVDPASEQRERDLVTFAEPRDDPSGLVHPVPHLRYEFLCAGEEQRPRQLDPDRDVRTFAAEKDEDLLADLGDVVAGPGLVRPSLGMLQRVSAKLLACGTRDGHSGMSARSLSLSGRGLSREGPQPKARRDGAVQGPRSGRSPRGRMLLVPRGRLTAG